MTSTMSEFRHSRMDYDDDPFANFSPIPTRPAGRLRSFTKRSKYQSLVSLASRERLPLSGSFTNLGSLSGSMQNLLDPSRMMNMQEDAKSRRISAEVMKHRLYESVILTPRRRRFSMRTDCGADDSMESEAYDAATRYAQSMPVTPAHSQNVTPLQSPTSHRKFHWSYWPSRGSTPRSEVQPEMVEEEEIPPEDAWKGLASLFRPSPRCISAHETTASQQHLHQTQLAQDNDENSEEEAMDMDYSLMPPPSLPPLRHHRHQNLYSPKGGGGDSLLQHPDSNQPFSPDDMNTEANTF